ncbi:MAG: tetratricopeptide repeat protein [Deltaproteobacteria bacterium]|nr:tetratricopeptide repeat protein [Deltaproteobacteria bacterium]MBW2075732.1 tetratricopeptide repeat protein [Deltaproteobacteria bacterium]
MNTLKFIALTVVVCLCLGCNKQEDSPIDQQEKVYRALLLDGNRLLKKKKYQKASDLFTEAISKQPEKAEGYLNRGIAYLCLERYKEGILDFTKAIQKDRALAIAYANRGIANDHLGKHKEALSDYQKALALDPETGKRPGFMERFLYNKPKTPSLRERAEFLEKTLKTQQAIENGRNPLQEDH